MSREASIDSKQPLNPVVQALADAATEIIAAAPAGWNKELEAITVANVTGAADTFSLYLHEDGVAPAAGNAICIDVPINANTLYQLPVGPFTLPAG